MVHRWTRRASQPIAVCTRDRGGGAMVRRSTVDRSPQPSVHDDADFDPGARNVVPEGGMRQRPAGTWRGAGGRWLVWAFRVVVWAVLLIIGYRGVTAIVLNETPGGSRAAPAPSQGTGFPAMAAGAYAMAFAQVYLNANPASAAQRASELSQFLPPGTDPQLGWNGQGTLAP